MDNKFFLKWSGIEKRRTGQQIVFVELAKRAAEIPVIYLNIRVEQYASNIIHHMYSLLKVLTKKTLEKGFFHQLLDKKMCIEDSIWAC